MSALADLAAAIVIAGAALWGVLSGTDVFEAMLDGIKDGLGVLLRIHWQALRLALKRVPFFAKPVPPDRFVTR